MSATLEHVRPLSEGGSWQLDNLRLSCKSCNQERKTIPFDEWRKAVRWFHEKV
jgi:5-methylcytosine-specific restriction endonuclease McrA